MHTFFVKYDKKPNVGEILEIRDKDDCFHIGRSLRMAVGEKLKVSDGECQYICTLTSIHDTLCELRIDEILGKVGEPPYRALIFQGLPKGDKLELIIQKGTEFGADGFIPFVSDFCTAKPKDPSSEKKKTARREAIAKEAAKQCGRTTLPFVSETFSFSEMLSEIGKADVILFCCEFENAKTLSEVMEERDLSGKTLAIVIGSEGGFSEREAERICEAGGISLSLGERILRAESASMYVLSALSCRYEL